MYPVDFYFHGHTKRTFFLRILEKSDMMYEEKNKCGIYLPLFDEVRKKEDIMNRRLYKSEDNRVLCGVCGGLGEFLGIDPTIVRLIWAVLCIAAGSGILLYIIAAIIIPRQPLD